MDNVPIQKDPEFIANLKEYLSLEKKVDEFKASLKKLEDRKKLLYAKIHHKMIEKKVDTLKLPNGAKIKNYVRKTKESINKKFIENRLKLYCEQRQLDYDEISDFIYNPKYRQVIENMQLESKNQKKKKKIKIVIIKWEIKICMII